MGWGIVRNQVYDKQGGCCSICGLFLKEKWVIHHKINKAQSGPYTLENAEARHAKCEKYMHANYPRGNYQGSLVRNEHIKRRRKGKGNKKR